MHKAHNVPPPNQPHLRIWVGGGGEKRTIPIAARYADGYNVAYAAPDATRHKFDVLEEEATKAGRDPAEIARAVNVGFYMGVDQRSAEAKRGQLPWPDDDPRIGGLLTGTPEEAVERIGQYADAGAEQLNLAIRAPFDWDALQAFIEEVMPAIAV